MFDELRDTLRTMSSRLGPNERRRMTHGLRDALVHARLAVTELRAAHADTTAKLAAERRELETIRRRQGFAVEIGDTETVAIAERFAARHAEQVALLEKRLLVQQQELTLSERQYEEMSAELRQVMSGISPDVFHSDASSVDASSPEMRAAREVEALLNDEPAAAAPDDLLAEMSSRSRRTRAEREAEADARLAALKRQLGR